MACENIGWGLVHSSCFGKEVRMAAKWPIQESSVGCAITRRFPVHWGPSLPTFRVAVFVHLPPQRNASLSAADLLRYVSFYEALTRKTKA